VLWLGLNEMFLVHTMQVRGYGLSMALGTMLFAYAVRPSIRRRWFVHGGAILGMALFLYTIPTNVLFLGPLCAAALVNVWMSERRSALVVSEAIRWAAGAALGVVFYSPVLREVLEQRGTTADWWEGARAFARVLDVAWRDAPWLWIGVLPGLLLWWLRVRRERPARAFVLPVALAIAGFGPFILQSAARMPVPYDRIYCPVLPIWALAGGWLLWEILEGLRRLIARLPRAVVPAVGGALILAMLLPRVLTYPARLAAVREQSIVQDGYFCYYAADFHPSQVVEYAETILSSERSYMVSFDRRGWYTLEHYFRRAGVPYRNFRYDEAGSCLAEMYYVMPKHGSLDDVAKQSGVPVAQLQTAREICDLGFYHVYRLPGLVKIVKGSAPGSGQ
jgi:hypothetical protein